MARPPFVKEISRISIYYPALAVRAVAECAGLVLPIFEKMHPRDLRPRVAIAMAHAWARGTASTKDVRYAYDAMDEFAAGYQDQHIEDLPLRERAYDAAVSAREAIGLARNPDQHPGSSLFYRTCDSAIRAIGGETRGFTTRLHRTWLPPILFGMNHRWATVYQSNIPQSSGQLALAVPAVPYRQEWPMVLHRQNFPLRYPERGYEHDLVFTMAEAWSSKYFDDPAMFVALDAALEGRA